MSQSSPGHLQIRPRILIIDDARTARLYHRHQLAGMGLDMDEAVNGLEALEMCRNNAYDLLLVDINMPEQDGLRFLAELRSDLALNHIPAIIISTESLLEDRQQAWSVGANFYLIKPTRPEQLRRTVGLMLGVRPQ